jgi:hypothetical protein
MRTKLPYNVIENQVGEFEMLGDYFESLDVIAKDKGFNSHEESEEFRKIKNDYLYRFSEEESRIPLVGYSLERIFEEKGVLFAEISKKYMQKEIDPAEIIEDFSESIKDFNDLIGFKPNINISYDLRKITLNPLDIESRASLNVYESFLSREIEDW